MNTCKNVCKIFKTYNAFEEILKQKGDKNMDVILSHFQAIALSIIKSGKNDVRLAKYVLKTLDEIFYQPFIGTMTLTFGEVAESHVGMEKIGEMSDRGFSYDELVQAQSFFKSMGCDSVIVHLNDFLPETVNEDEQNALDKAKTDEGYQAWILVIRNGMKCLGDTNGKNILTEMLMFKWDNQYWDARRSRVLNKRARHNLNFSDKHTSADFKEGKGTTIAWNEVPLLKDLKKGLSKAFGESADELKCEGNLYYNPKNTGIGYHGDTERKKVIGVRLGKKMSMHYMWYYNDRPRGLNVGLTLNPGDIYCMSEKTVGTDWRARPKKQYTLRHAAGADKYTIKTPKIRIKNTLVSDDYPDIIVGDIWYKASKTLSDPDPEWTEM